MKIIKHKIDIYGTCSCGGFVNYYGEYTHSCGCRYILPVEIDITKKQYNRFKNDTLSLLNHLQKIIIDVEYLNSIEKIKLYKLDSRFNTIEKIEIPGRLIKIIKLRK